MPVIKDKIWTEAAGKVGGGQVDGLVLPSSTIRNVFDLLQHHLLAQGLFVHLQIRQPCFRVAASLDD